MAFSVPKNQAAIANKILNLLGFNTYKDLEKNCLSYAGSPDGTVPLTGIKGNHLVLDTTNNAVYARTGYMGVVVATPYTATQKSTYVQIA